MKLSDEEKLILNEYEKGNIKTRTPSKSEIENIKMIVRNTFRKDR